MRMSQVVAPTLREDPAEAEVVSHKLMLRAGYIRKLSAGIYTFLPLGFKVLNKTANIIREEMARAGAQEVLLPTLLPAELWQETGRWEMYGKELFRIKDRHERDFCLGPTHEEIITDLIKTSLRSYKQLPVTLFQIQTKFRDEIRPRFGLMRGREFLMKDAYSFHADEASLEKEYKNMFQTYCRIFDRMGLNYRIIEADSGLIGGGFSEEFLVLADEGEEEILACTDCKYAVSWKSFAQENDSCPKCGKGKLIKIRGIEVGHIFKLGAKYSEKMRCVFLDENNQEKPMVMGCYGIGVGRTVAAAIEQNHDKDGIIWPMALSPYQIAVIPVNANEKEQNDLARKIYAEGLSQGMEIILDDRDERVGVKLKDIDLIGIPVKVIIGKALKEGKIEVKSRKSGLVELVPTDRIIDKLQAIIRAEIGEKK